MLSSVELQVLTGSCFKLRTVHNIPVTSNKDGEWPLAPAVLGMMLQDCGVPELERGLCCAGDSFPPGGTAGAASGSPAEQSRLQRGAAFGLSPSHTMGWAGAVFPG